jgi:hypothetical protein
MGVGAVSILMERADMRRVYPIAYALILVITAVSITRYFSFTAEDAYITYRYAENLVHTGALVFNQGEPINAMTSPFHALLSAALFVVTGNTVVGNKILALILLLASAGLIWLRFRERPQWQLLAVALLLMPPSVLLWTLGGLETPILLFLVTATVFLVERGSPMGPGRLETVFFLAGLGFLTRHDSLLFFTPLLIYEATRARSVRHLALGVGAAAVLPLAWLAVAVFYYGDPLPTSFYVKTPNGNVASLVYNGLYIALYFLLVGIIPVVAFGFLLLRAKVSAPKLLYGHFRSMWWLYLGIALELAYGLTMATHHMMFSFRFFIPYLPAAVILAVDLARRAAESEAIAGLANRSAAPVAAFLLCLALFQLYQNQYTYQHSVNGLAPIGEYRSVGLREYVRFMNTLEQAAEDVASHWESINGDQPRQPRIITFAAGIMPYSFRDSYIYEQLVSYRHCFQRHQQALYADYIHIMAPRHGSVEEQLPLSDDNYSLISAYEVVFDGSPQQLLVFYNPAPESHNLSARIADPCQQGDSGVRLSGP